MHRTNYNIKQISKLIDKIVTKTRLHFATTPTGEEFESFVRDVHESLPEQIRFDTVFASLMYLAGSQLNADVIKQVAWRLAGNLHVLKKNIPVPPWTSQPYVEWVPVNVVRAGIFLPTNNRGGICEFFIRILAGLSAGMLVQKSFPSGLVRMIGKDIGFGRLKISKGDYLNFPLTNYHQLVKMRFWMTVNPEKTRDGVPGLDNYWVSPTFKKHNKKLLLTRARLLPCPLKFKLEEMQCHDCPQGNQHCFAAVHPLSYKSATCPKCSNEIWYDPFTKTNICKNCIETEKNERAKEWADWYHRR